MKKSNLTNWLFVEADENGFTGMARVLAAESPWDGIEVLHAQLTEEGNKPERAGIHTTLHLEGGNFWYWLEAPGRFGLFNGVREKGPGIYDCHKGEDPLGIQPPVAYRVTYSNLQKDPQTGDLEVFVLEDRDGFTRNYEQLYPAIAVAQALVLVGAAVIASVYQGEVLCYEVRKDGTDGTDESPL